MRKFGLLLIGLLLIVMGSVPLANADTIIFNDTFTETVNVSLPSHTPDTGTSWTKILSRDTAGDQLQALALDNLGIGIGGCGNNEGAGYTADATYSGANYYVEVTMTTGDTADDFDWIGVRLESDGDGYWLRFNNDATTFAQVFEVSGGGVTWTALGSAAAAQIANASVVKLEIIGSNIKVYDDGVQIISTSDGTYTAAGKAGVGMGDLRNNGTDDCSGQVLDDFKVTIVEAASSTTAPAPIMISIF